MIYISLLQCDSEGEDDKGSDAESILFESSTPPPLARKCE